MTPQLQATADGSFTLRLDEIDETYHSTNGALTEAQHVFIKNGFERYAKEEIKILEIGFGTGLNALVTLDAFLKQDKIKRVHYTSLEKYPVKTSLTKSLNYGQLLSPSLEQEFLKMHQSNWEEDIKISPSFLLQKKEFDLLEQTLEGEYDLIYYDAFAPSKQATMWEDDILQKVINTMTPNAIFTTYCAKGSVRRALQSFGLEMQRIPGPPGKREMLFGIKE